MNDETHLEVSVDFGVPAAFPLVKKFGVMNSGMVPLDRYRRDQALLGKLQPDSLRIDLSIGKEDSGWLREIVDGSANALTYHWDEIDELSRLAIAQGVTPYWGFCYMPQPLQQGTWRSPPSDYGRWEEAHRAFSSHFRDTGIAIGCYEVYNEPDFDMFFAGSRDDYFRMYEYAVRGLIGGDPEAIVGGPSLAYRLEWVEPFLEFVQERRLPLHFFSFHAINPAPESGPASVDSIIRLTHITAALAARPYLRDTRVHLNEYHPWRAPETLEDPFPLAARLLDDFEVFLHYPRLDRVHWAQFMDPGVSSERYGLVDVEGKTKPAFDAFTFYNEMPMARCFSEAPDSLGVMASVDESTASVLIWNRTAETMAITVRFAGIPFLRHRLRLSAIHEGCGKGSEAEHDESDVAQSESAVFGGGIGGHGVLYLRWSDAGTDAS